MKELILKLRAALATLTLDDTKKKDIENQIAQLETEAAKPPESKTSPTQAGLDEATRQLITSLEGQVKGLSDALGAETKARADQAKAMADQAKKDRDRKVSDFIEKMKKEGRMTGAQEEKDKKHLEADYESWSEEISVRPVNAAIKKADGKTPQKTTDGSDKNIPTNDYFSNKKSFVDAAIEELKSSTN